MEGRVSPTTGDDPAGDDPPLLSAAYSSPPCSARPSHETYVIQIPKNQVYRVPPPENAIIAERFRNGPGPETNKAKKPRLSGRLLISIVVLIVFIIIAITMMILYLVLSPNGPMFSVLKVVVIQNPKSSTKSKNKHPSYEISLAAKNPNTRTGFDYETSGGVALLFGGKEIANGKFPAFHQEKDNSTKLKLVMSGSTNAGLPHEMEKTMNETKSKEPLSLALAMDVRMKMEFWFIKTWIMDSKTNCDFKVSTLGPDSRVVSQKCHSKFKR